MNRILLLAIAASSGAAAAAAETPSAAVSASGASSGEVVAIGVQYDDAATMMQTLTSTISPTPTSTTADTDAVSTRHSKSAKNQKEGEIPMIEMQITSSSTTAAATTASTTTLDPIQHENGNHSSSSSSHAIPNNLPHVHQNHQRPETEANEGGGSGGEGDDQQHDLFGKSSKSKGGKSSPKTSNKKNPPPTDTTWAPGSSTPPSLVPVTSLPPTSTSSSSSSLQPTPTTTTTPLPALTWMGVNGCTPTNPCPVCSGDCDTDSDCLQQQIIDGNNTNNDDESTTTTITPPDYYLPMVEIVSLEQQKRRHHRGRKHSDSTTTTTSRMTMACYKRADGSTAQVPGCQMGGEGDVPGADYCYYKHHDDDDVVTDDDDKEDEEDCNDGTGVPTYLPTMANSVPTTTTTTSTGTTTTPAPTVHSSSFSGPPVTNILTMAPSSSSSTTIHDGTLPPTSSRSPSSSSVEQTTLWPSSSGILDEEEKIEAYFIQSKFVGSSSGSSASVDGSTTTTGWENGILLNTPRTRQRRRRRNLQEQEGLVSSSSISSSSGAVYWCASGALSPDHYQLQIEQCAYDNDYGASGTNNVIVHMEQMDQLWSMDSEGYIHSVWDYERCMTVPLYAMDNNNAVVDNMEQVVPVKIGPCNHDASALSQFYYDQQLLKLVGYNRLCVTYEEATKGSPLILGPCQENEDTFGWDFVLKPDQVDVPEQPSSAPVGANITSSPVASSTDLLPRLQYLGREGCGGVSMEPSCQLCAGDCDVDDDCSSGLLCFQREVGDSTQVPGCALGGPGDIPGADYCFDPTFVDDDTNGEVTFPSLRWRGAEGCNSEHPCPACTGDCDEDEDCQGLYECLKRLVGETTQVPGCAVGGSGDIPGGDYCYDPGASLDGVISGTTTTDSSMSVNEPPSISTQPTALQSMPISSPPIPSPSQLQYLGRNVCNMSAPCKTCTGDCDSDDDCSGELMCFQRAMGDSSQVPGCEVGGLGDMPGGDYCFDPAHHVDGSPVVSATTLVPTSTAKEPLYPTLQSMPIPSPPTSSPALVLSQLQYLGRNVCNISAPCQRCNGDCDSDDDCSGELICFQRSTGDSSQVPGCEVGGLGDITGGDYCFDPTHFDGSPVVSATTAVPTSTSAEVSSMPLLRWRGTEGCTPESPCLACVGECDDDNDCDGTLMCFKRLLGEKTPIPGCAVGGLDDIPGGDYCYDPSILGASMSPSQAVISPPSFSVQPETVTGPSNGFVNPTDLGGEILHSTINSEYTATNQGVPSSAPTAASELGLPTVGDASGMPSVAGSSEEAKKRRESKSAKVQHKELLTKGKHNDSVDSSTAEIERRRKHESTRKEREHLNTKQKENERAGKESRQHPEEREVSSRGRNTMR